MTVRSKAVLGIWTIAAALAVAIVPLWRLGADDNGPGQGGTPELPWKPAAETTRNLSFVTTDKPIYREGESVYLRGLLLNHASRTPYTQQTNGVLKILGPKDEVIVTQMVRTEHGAWGTKWDVPAEMAGGEYTAKVEYPFNGFPPAERKFDVRQYRAPRLKSQIKFIRDGYGPGDEVAATLEVERAEGGVPAGAPVSVTARVDGKKVHDGRAEVGADGTCVVRFPLPDKIKRGEGTLALAIHDGGVVETAAKTIPILLQSVDIELYPEGGQLVEGLPSRIYFEAFTPAGKPADLAGDVIDDRGRMVAMFRSEHEGRGRIEMTPQPGRSYKLRFTEPAGITQQVAVPAAEQDGILVGSEQNVFDHGQPIALTVGSSQDEQVEVVVRQRDRVVARKRATLKAGDVKRVSLNLGDQPNADGVLTVTVNDGKNRPRAERLVFRRPQHSLQVKITPEASTGFVPGGKVRLKVETADAEGNPVSALVGIRVTDESVLEMIDRREQAPALPVMVLLENEVQDLADAHVYLDPENAEAPLAIDLLLGVQGWRRWALVNPNKFLADNGDSGRRVLADVKPAHPQGGFGMGGMAGFGGGGGFGGAADPFGAPAPAPGAGLPAPPAAAPAPAAAADGGAFGGEPGDAPAGRPADDPFGDDGAGAAVPDAKEDRAGAKDGDKLAEEKQVQFGNELEFKKELKQVEGNLEAARLQKIAANQAPGDEAPALAQERRRLRAGGAARDVRGGLFGEGADEEMAMDMFMALPQQITSVRIYAHQVRSGRRPGQRIDFTETLFWTAGVKTDDKGVAEVEFGLSDAVTTFEVLADAVDGRGALGSGTFKVESVEPFYLEPKLPLEVTMGDLIQTPLGVVNSTGQEMKNVKIDVRTEGLDGDATIAPFTLDGGERARKRLNIHVGDFVGEAELKITSSAGDYRDQVTRKLKVAPLGFPYEESGGALLTPDGIVAVEIEIPDAVVPGSVKAQAMAFPTPLATMTASLERLIREPYGCFEQTSSTTYPLVMAQTYFKTHQGVDPELIKRSAATLAKGYERLLGFESPSGGFEWFGNDPGHDALTAYGLLEFTDMSAVRAVDSAMLERTRKWLLKQRDGDGGYVRKTHTLHTWLAEPEVAFSYNTWALLEAGADPTSLAKEIEWVGRTAEQTSNTYVMALGANVLAKSADADAANAANRLLDKLAGLQAADGSLQGATVSVVGSGGEALTIEATSLAMLAWLTNPSYTEQVERGIKYLAEVCKGGRFGSTQSTVLALRAIVDYDGKRAQTKAPGEISLWVDGRKIGKPVEFGKDTHGSIVLPDFVKRLKPGKHQVELRMKGGVEMPCLVNVEYNTLQPPSSEDCQLHLEVKLKDRRVREGETTDAEVVVVNRSEKQVPTPTAIVGIPGGLEVRHDQLKEAVEQGLIAAYEVRGREVILYWRVLDGEQRVRVPLSLVAAVPGKYTAPASRAYLYYTDEHKHWVEGLRATVLPAE